jgi:hypothetical protein
MNMTKQVLLFGKVVLSSDKNSISGTYSAIDWQQIKKHSSIRIYPPAYGSPLLREKKGRNYSFNKAKK